MRLSIGKISGSSKTLTTGSIGLIWLAIAVVILSYWLMGLPAHQSRVYNLHEHLGDAFIHLQTYTRYPVSIDLLNALNPYDPMMHTPYNCLWDASLYNGKYYIYFGPLPALLFWVPYKLLTGLSMTTTAMAFLFASVGTASLIIALHVMLGTLPRRQYLPAMFFGTLAISYGTFVPYILKPSTYEVSILGSYCFTAMGFMFLALAARGSTEKPHYKYMVLASLSMGLAVTCRHLHVLNVLGLFIAWLMFCKQYRQQWLALGLALSLPWLFCIECLMAYNYLRFGNVFETGMTYQLTIEDLHKSTFTYIRPDKFLSNLYLFLLRPVEWNPQLTFPPFNVQMGYRETILGFLPVKTTEPIFGLLTNAPFVLFLFAPVALRSGAWLLHTVAFYGLLLTAYMLVFVWTTQRYSVDFSPWLMFAAAVRFSLLLNHCKTRAGFNVMVAAGAVASLYSAFTGIMLNLSR